MSASQSSDRTSLWFFITALSIGGAEQTLVDLANNLDESKYEVTIWTLFDSNPLASDLRPGIDLRTLGVSGETDKDDTYVEGLTDPRDVVTAPLRFAVALRRKRPDIVQSFLLYDNVIARLAGILSPSTVVVSGVRSVPTRRPFWQEFLDRTTLPLADHVVSNSRAGSRFIVKRGASPDDVEVIHNGRDVEKYDRPDDDTELPLTVPNGAPLVGTVGRLIERKGHYDLLDAWPDVLESRPNARLVFVGDGPERSGLERRADQKAIGNSVDFLGFRDDIPQLLEAFDVFVFPSHFEGLPGALLEAMAAGCPIVTTPVDGSAELVSNYRDGLHVGVGASDEIAEAITLLLDYPNLADDLATNAQNRAKSSFTIPRMVDEFDSFYSRVLSPDG